VTDQTTSWKRSAEDDPSAHDVPDPEMAATARRFHVTHAIFGIVFIGIGLFGLGGDPNGDVSWVWVGLLAAAGLAGLVAVVNGIRATGFRRH
jgi:hypothetical protein